MDLDGAVAIVTGGASGLGRATTELLLGRGAQVVVADLASSPGAETADELGADCHFVSTDVTDGDAVAEAVDTATSLGDLRVLVNCAGIGTPGRVLSRSGPMPLEQFEQVVRVNLIGTFNVIRLAAAAMALTDPVAGERGVIVNTASVAAFEGQIGQAAYSASKGGVVGMTLSVARDLADKLIRVCTIAPGLFSTPMLHGLPDEAKASLAASVPMPARLGEPAEYAALAGHIIDNQMLNGEVIRLDGAIRMAPR
jgi:NAD(P)-dependent dehydrogenase (short-subunit alcohol dehydrogenase family)